MLENSKIYIAGHTGLVGSALHRNLIAQGYYNLITADRSKLDLTKQHDVYDFFKSHRPEYVFLSAALVGGIMANSLSPADFIFSNLSIQVNVIDAAYRSGVRKLLFLGSSCVYPRIALTPITEDQLLSGPLEKTNESYAVAKIAGIKMCEAYRTQHGFDAISVMPTNLYGYNDNFDENTGHVLPSMLVKFDRARKQNTSVQLWGDGSAMREFLHVDDLARACILCMKKYSNSDIINIGTGQDISIKDLADIIGDVVGFNGDVIWDNSKPNGTPRKVLNVDKIRNLGWQHIIDLRTGIEETYKWYKQCQT